MGNYSSFYMFENPRRGRQARNFTTNVPKILDVKSSSEQIFSENSSPKTSKSNYAPPQNLRRIERSWVGGDRIKAAYWGQSV